MYHLPEREIKKQVQFVQKKVSNQSFKVELVYYVMAVPSKKAQRYDRQLRLWGDHGQNALESSRICLINASATGTEILKNLVLPGVGTFTIIDSKRITQSDLGSNFFVTSDVLGANRGKAALSLLRELNLDVRGKAIDDNFESILSTNPDFFSQFSVVVATELAEEEQLQLSRELWKSSVPLLIVSVYGLIGYVRIAVQEHEIIESHPDNYHEDLRLDCPFTALQNHVDSIDFDILDDTQHVNVPFLIILLKYLQLWKSSHEGSIPASYREKQEFKEIIKAGVRVNEDGVSLDEENFDEAIKNVNSTIQATHIPSAVQSLLEASSCTCITPESSDFWLLARAVREFVACEGKGLLPLRGSIPDMTSSSDMYVELQRVYQTKARADMEAVASHLSELLASIGKPTNTISEKNIKLFCRNCAFLQVLQYRALEEEFQKPNMEGLRALLENPDSDLVYYILLRAAHQFYSIRKVFPGEEEGQLDSDVSHMKSIVGSLLHKWGLSAGCIRDDYIVEFCRYGGGEIHTVSAFIGGVAAQEIIKLITHQFVPLNNTLIYNAITSTTITVLL